jgi:hypothetical protein
VRLVPPDAQRPPVEEPVTANSTSPEQSDTAIVPTDATALLERIAEALEDIAAELTFLTDNGLTVYTA